MPTVLMRDGYRFFIYPNDHPPAHVHVRKAGHEARVQLEPVAVVTNYGFQTRELSRIVGIVQNNLTLLLAAWDDLHDRR